MEILKDRYKLIRFEPETGILYQEWFNTTEFMFEQDYKQASVNLPEIAEKNGAKKVLINAINSMYIVDPQIQDWVNENTVPKYLKAGVLKLAILSPIDLFTQVSVEQIIEDSIDKAKSRIKYFDNEKEAREWLME